MISPWTGIYTDMSALVAGSEPIRLLAAQDGYYEIRTTPVGTFRVRRPDLELESCTEGVALAVPRMPAELLAALIDRFRDALPDEYLINVYWNSEREGFEIEAPPQEAGEAHVTTGDTTDPYDPRRPRVLQAHSHALYSAVFSATDDADEQATGCYGVIGNLDHSFPTMAWRFVCGGWRVSLTTSDLFTL